ncbi:MAG: filamentous hemagglutinin N-terminal domain-containing protein [Campylobacterales bacterium]
MSAIAAAGLMGNAAFAIETASLANSSLSSAVGANGDAPTFTIPTGGVGVVDLKNNTRALLKWEALGIGSGESLTFGSAGANAIIVNKVTGTTSTGIYGSMTAPNDASVILINPNGITIGSGANLGGISNLVLSGKGTTLDSITFNSISDVLGSLTVDGSNVTYNVNLATKAGGSLYIYNTDSLNNTTYTIQTGTLTLNAGGEINVKTTANIVNATNSNNGNITISNSSGALGIGTINAGTGTVYITAAGAITDAQGTSDTATNITAGTIKLNSGASDIGESSNKLEISASDLNITSAGNVYLASAGNINLNQLEVSGSQITIDAGSNTVTQTTNISLSAPTTTLDFGLSTFNQVSGVSLATDAADKSIVLSAGAMDLKSVATTGTGEITIHAGGAITANSLSASSITIDGGYAVDANTTTSTLTLTTGATTITNTGDLNISGTLSGDSSITASSIITIGNLNGGTSNLTLTTDSLSATSTITADTLTINQKTDGKAIAIGTTGTGTLDLTDATLSNISANTIAIGKTTGGGAITVDTVDVGTSNLILNATTLGATATGTDITAGNLTVTTTGGDVTLDSAIAGITVSGTNTGVTIADAGMLTINGITSGGNVSVTTTGAQTIEGNITSAALTLNAATNNITQSSGAITATGALSLTGGTITLDQSGNSFGAITVASGSGDVTINESAAMDIAAITRTSGNVTLTSTNDMTTSGNISTSDGNGSILLQTSSGSIDLTGDTLNAGSGDITLRALDGDVAVETLTTTGGIAIAAGSGTISGIPNGTFEYVDLNASSNITLSGALTTTGEIDATTHDGIRIYTGGTFIQGANALSTGATGKNISITAATDIVLDANLTTTGTVTLQQASGATAIGLGDGTGATFDLNATELGYIQNGSSGITIGRSGATGAMTVNATTFNDALTLNAGAITNGGLLTMSGNDQLTVNAASATLQTATTGVINLNTTGNASITNTGATQLQGSVGGNMVVSASGAITDSGALSVTGTTTITASGHAVTLDAGNNLAGDINVTAASFTLNNGAHAISMGNTSLTGDLSLTSTSGGITDSGTLSVGGTTTLAAGATNDITLNSSDNNFSTVSISSGKDVTLVDTNAIDLGASTVSGNLSITAGGAVTDSGALSVTGTTTISATGQDVTLDTATNNFTGAVAVTGANVTLVDTNAIDLNTSTISGNLSIIAGGEITDSGTVSASSLSFTAGGAVTLDQISVDSIGNSVAGGDVALTNNKDANLTVGNILVYAADETTANNYTVSIDNTMATGKNIVLNGTIAGSDNNSSANLYLGAITVKNDITGASYITGGSNNLLKAKKFDLYAHGKIGSSTGQGINVDWKDATVSTTNALKLYLGNLSGDSDGDVNITTPSGGHQIVSSDITNRYVVLDFTADSTYTTTADGLVTNGDLVGTGDKLNDYNTNTFGYVNERIDRLEEIIGIGFDSNNTVAKYISYIVNGSAGITGFEVDGVSISGGMTPATFLANAASGQNLAALKAGFSYMTDSTMTWSAANSVTAGSLDAAKFADGNITTSKLADATLLADESTSGSIKYWAKNAIDANTTALNSTITSTRTALESAIDNNSTAITTAYTNAIATARTNLESAIDANRSAITTAYTNAIDANTTSLTIGLANANTRINEVNATSEFANAKVDALATFRNGQVAAAQASDINATTTIALKEAVDATNAKASGIGLGTTTNSVKTLEGEADTGNIFLNFFRRLFGGN